MFDSLFSLSRTVCGKMSNEIIDKLEIVIKNTLSCWRHLRLSTKMVKMNGLEDYFFESHKKNTME